MQPSQQLAEQAAAIQAAMRASGRTVLPPQNILSVSFAHLFLYNVTKGGFAQLIYNAQGEYLHEIEQALSSAGATVAGQFYERAIRLCLADTEAYQKFLDNQFTEESELRNSLHSLSIEYFRARPSFEQEAASFIAASAKPVEAWLLENERNGG